MMGLVFSLTIQTTLALGFLQTAAVLTTSKWFFCVPSMKINFVSIQDHSRMQLTHIELIQPCGVNGSITTCEGRAKS